LILLDEMLLNVKSKLKYNASIVLALPQQCIGHVMIVQITNRHNRVYSVQQHSVVDRAFGSGIYQVSSLRYLRGLVPAARRIVDVGANVGTNTIEYATWAQNVEAFECSDTTYHLLLQNIAAKGFTAMNIASQ
jgi:hypothetical protein